MNTANVIENLKLTENGDLAFKSTTDDLLDIFFMSAYYEKHLDEVELADNELNRLFAMFMRDPRNGLGRRDLGRVLMKKAGCKPEEIVKAGRYDDLLAIEDYFAFWKKQVLAGNQLAKKWAPRLTGKDGNLAKKLAKKWGVSEKQYRALIKLDNTVEYKLSNKDSDINYQAVPSLAMLKYYQRFLNGQDTKEAFKEYLKAVKEGKKDIKLATATVYDIYRNRNVIDADMYFDKIEKISINCLPVIDTSGSMMANDALGKALAIGHYLAKCSSFAPNIAVPFSSKPYIIDVTEERKNNIEEFFFETGKTDSAYNKEIDNLFTGDYTNTNLVKVMQLAATFDKVPEYLVILSDMEFDQGSYYSKQGLKRFWDLKGYSTKIVWWNLNSRNKTAPETDEYGNIFISGYNPMMLKYLQAGFDGKQFLSKLLAEYEKTLN